MAFVISADEIKKTFPDYSPERVEEFHQESAKRADKQLSQALKTVTYTNVILLSGGTASGKTEFMSTQLMRKRGIIFDATLSTELGARNKIRQIYKLGKKPIIYSVIPDDLKRAFIAFLNRDRKFSDEHFYKTHAGSRKVLLFIAKNYPKIPINIIESSYTVDQILQFAKIEFESNQAQLKYLLKIQLSEDDIIKEVI